MFKCELIQNAHDRFKYVIKISKNLHYIFQFFGIILFCLFVNWITI